MNAILNDCSLEGQFQTIDEFEKSLVPFFKLYKFLDETHRIWHYSTLYKASITEHIKFSDIKNMRSDTLSKLRIFLNKIEKTEPFWDYENQQQLDEMYLYNERDVSATALAEAYAREGILISFQHKVFYNTYLDIEYRKETRKIASACTKEFALMCLYKKSNIARVDYLKHRFEEGHIDFSQLGHDSGLDKLEEPEFNRLLETIEYFNHFDSWEDILTNRVLAYKSYKAEGINNVFQDTKYKSKNIDKFRLTGRTPMRCFGYRKDKKFVFLRIYRTHKVSDKG